MKPIGKQNQEAFADDDWLSLHFFPLNSEYHSPPPNGEKFFAKGKSCQKQTFSAWRGVDAERGAVFFYILVSPGDPIEHN